MRFLCLALLIAPSIQALSAFFAGIDTAVLRRADSLMTRAGNKAQVTYVEKLDMGGTVYFASTFKTLPFTLARIRAKFENERDYHNTFKFMKKAVRVRTDSVCAPMGTFFFEVGVLFARSWFLADVDSVGGGPDRFEMFFVQNKDSVLNARWREEKGSGWFTVEYHDFRLAWLLWTVDEKKTRAALIACVRPKIWIPGWLFKLVSKVVFPRFVRDVEKALESEGL